MHDRTDGGQRHVVGHLLSHFVHVEVFWVDGLHVLDDLISIAKECGIDHVVLPERYFLHVALVEQRELLQELPQAKEVAHLVELVAVLVDARLRVQRLDEPVGSLGCLSLSFRGRTTKFWTIFPFAFMLFSMLMEPMSMSFRIQADSRLL